MKCIKCQGTGLESEVKICDVCLGFGVVGGEEPITNESEVIEVSAPVIGEPEKIEEKKNSVSEESVEGVAVESEEEVIPVEEVK